MSVPHSSLCQPVYPSFLSLIFSYLSLSPCPPCLFLTLLHSHTLLLFHFCLTLLHSLSLTHSYSFIVDFRVGCKMFCFELIFVFRSHFIHFVQTLKRYLEILFALLYQFYQFYHTSTLTLSLSLSLSLSLTCSLTLLLPYFLLPHSFTLLLSCSLNLSHFTLNKRASLC